MRYVINYTGGDQQIQQELLAIQQAIETLNRLTIELSYEEPEKPREGQVYVADGTSWNPLGTGTKSPVLFQDDTWVALGGGTGVPGPPGQDGADGAMWFTGNGEPTDIVPAGTQLGDFYLDEDTGNYYEVTGEAPIVWTLRGNLAGPAGSDGADGQNAINGIITNDAHVVQADNAGGSYTLVGAGGTFLVFDGFSQVSSGVTFSIVSADTIDGLTISINTSGVYTLSGGAWNSDQVTFSLQAEYNSVIITKDYTIAKAREGSQGNVGANGQDGLDGISPITGLLTNESHVVAASADGTGYSLIGAGGVLKIFEGTTEVTNSTAFSIIGGDTKNGLTITINAGNGTYTLSGANWTSDLETFTVRGIYNAIVIDKDYTIAKARAGLPGVDGSDGVDGITPIVGFLTNQTHVIAANNDGTGYSLAGAGGTFEVFEGIVEVTSSSVFSVVGAATKNGLTFSINASTGVYSLSGANWTSDSEFFTVQATYNSVTIELDYTIAKARIGADGSDGAAGAPGAPGSDGSDGQNSIIGLLTNESHVVDANNNGTGYSLVGAGGTFEVYDGITNVSNLASFSVVGASTKNGLSFAINSAGVYSLSGAAWTTESETFTPRGTYNAVNVDKIYSIAKSIEGAEGPTGPTGPTGPQGPQGPAGGTGCSLNTLTNHSVFGFVIDPANSSAAIQLNADGQMYSRADAAGLSPYETWRGSCASNEYECYLERTAGSNPTGSALNTWLSCAISRTWQVAQNSLGVTSFTGTLKIRRTTDNVVIDFVTITLVAEVDV